jgi:uncharacterized protein YecT (DUF1311 family)
MHNAVSKYRSLLLIILFLFVLSSPTFCGQSEDNAQTSRCEKLGSTAEKSECYMQQLMKAEAEMQKSYQYAQVRFTPDIQELKEINALPKYDREFAFQSNRKMLRKLKKSQKAWFSYRESACGAVEQKYEGGTITALVIPLCKIEITQQRTKFLVENFVK